MKTSTLQIAVPNGPSLHVHRWLPDGEPRATVQIIHGMSEHGARYARLAQALTGAGIAVYAPDLTGHGKTAGEGELGHFADRKGWSLALASVHAVHTAIARQHRRGKAPPPEVPVFMLGHSMGSFLLQHYVLEHGAKLRGAIFSATTGDMGLLRPLGLTLLRTEALILGRRHRSALAEALSFKDFNKKFKPARTGFDWLSRDTAEVDKYVADPLCGFRCSAGLWIELLAAGARLSDLARVARIPKTLPVLMIAGSRDPVSGGAAGPRVLERAYRAAGLKDVTVSIYDDARHELLNDLCREAVTAELRDWLMRRLAARTA